MSIAEIANTCIYTKILSFSITTLLIIIITENRLSRPNLLFDLYFDAMSHHLQNNEVY